MKHKITRRGFILGSLCSIAMPTLLGGFSSISYANAPTEKRLVLVFLRGGMDSLGAVIPYGDPAYKSARKSLAIEERDSQMIDINGRFAFHSSMKPLHDFYKRGELAVIHAVATPYRERSHFDAQDLLENGTTEPRGSHSGWLNRTIQVLEKGQYQNKHQNNVLGLSIGSSKQLILSGRAKVTTWSPSVLREVDEDLLDRISRMYEQDELLHEALEIAKDNMDISDVKGKLTRGAKSFISTMQAASKFLQKPKGPRIAVVDMNGWDTHSNQGSGKNGRLPALLRVLSEGVAEYRKGTADNVWKNTVIYIVSEFGRTVHPNGSGGTDHGTAGLSMVLGGNINGGRVITNWPGLSSSHLFEGRDLRPTTDLRSVSKSILNKHFGISPAVIDNSILPGTASLRPIDIL